MSSVLTLMCLLCMLAPPAVANIILYPVCMPACRKMSNYIVKVLGPRIFAILNCYKKFHFWSYRESKVQLPEQYMIISNHQSLLDIPCFMRFLPERDIRFVAKDSLSRHVPLVSEMLRSQEHCMIPRKAKPMYAMKLMEDFGKRTKERNQIPILFPEGTRTRDGNVGKFYSAGFRKLSESAKLPVAVCALDGGYQLRDLKKLMKNLQTGCYRVKVLKVYDAPENKEDCQKILSEAEVLIAKQLEEWRSKDSSQR